MDPAPTAANRQPDPRVDNKYRHVLQLARAEKRTRQDLREDRRSIYHAELQPPPPDAD